MNKPIGDSMVRKKDLWGNVQESQLIVSMCLLGLSLLCAKFDGLHPEFGGWFAVMAWLTVLTGWALFVGCIIRKFYSR